MQDQWKPPAGTEAFVEPSSGETDGVTALVLAGDSFVVAFSEDPPAEVVQGPVTLSCFTPDALHVVEATLRASDPPSRLFDVDLHDVAHVQRRCEPRAEVVLSVALSSADGPGPLESVVGRTRNISSGGCRVVTERPFPPGVDPTVTLRLASRQQPVVARAAILERSRADGWWDYRLVFTDIAIDDRARLSRLTRQAL